MKKPLKILLALMLFLAPLYARTLLESRSELQIAQKLQQQEQYSSAFSHYRTALSWWSPGNIYAQQAERQLEVFLADVQKSPELRIEAARALYEGLMTGRNLLHDDRSKRDQIKEMLYSLDPDAEPEFYRGNSTQVHYTFQILAQAGFWGWVCSVCFIIFYGYSRSGEPQWGAITKGAVSGLSFFLLWLLALSAA